MISNGLPSVLTVIMWSISMSRVSSAPLKLSGAAHCQGLHKEGGIGKQLH